MRLRPMVSGSLHAALLLAVANAGAGCGDDATMTAVDAQTPLPDAETPVDGRTPDAGPVTPDAGGGSCTARLAAGTLEGFDVVFHDATGEPIATVTTNADGVATHDGCVEGGMVTFVNRDTVEQVLITFQGVGPGDVVQWGQPPEPTVEPLTIELTTPDGGDLLATATLFQGRFGSCTILRWGTTPGGFMRVNEPGPCLGDNRDDFDVLAIASDASGDLVAFSRGTSTTFVGDPIPVSGADWVAYPGPSTIELTAPSSLFGGLSFFSLVDGVRSSPPAVQSYSAATSSVDVPAYPAGIADGYELSITGLWTGTSAALTRVKSPTLPTRLDLAELVLPRLVSTSLDRTEPLRPAVTWEGGAEGTTYMAAGIAWIDGDERGIWFVMAPGDTPRPLRVPTLPDSLAASQPGPTATLEITPNYFQNDLSWATYAEALAGGVTLDMISGLLIPVPSEGTFRHVFYDADGI